MRRPKELVGFLSYGWMCEDENNRHDDEEKNTG